MKDEFIKYLTDNNMLSQVKYEIWWSTGLSFEEYLNRTNFRNYMVCFGYPTNKHWFKLWLGWEEICLYKEFIDLACPEEKIDKV